ncbi:hypothetical protein [Gulosibacter sp. ACHW.36C]|uniref:Uncharacterized protein n=1 Tax=Gulosibacter sediminis TaxID=1729695 RepID=A0ABY4N0M2_9MICO|nr:hypothetical protein [Gulosibacter sediminis]UQN14992.1 hypothetical protein M3M28_00550 [Gulosibacter sediminis]
MANHSDTSDAERAWAWQLWPDDDAPPRPKPPPNHDNQADEASEDESTPGQPKV